LIACYQLFLFFFHTLENDKKEEETAGMRGKKKMIRRDEKRDERDEKGKMAKDNQI
jgi:hypothetical protein